LFWLQNLNRSCPAGILPQDPLETRDFFWFFIVIFENPKQLPFFKIISKRNKGNVEKLLKKEEWF